MRSVTFMLTLAATAASSVTARQSEQRFNEAVAAVETELIDVRRDLHRHPDLSGQEERTARVVADMLRSLGFTVHTGVGGHGVVGILEGTAPGRQVAFRADMDAVRSPAPDPVSFASEIPGVRHICGHDLHTTIGLGLAHGFAAVRTSLRGSVALIFQPAEETATGARAMINDGLFDIVSPDAIFAYHIIPANVGQIATADRFLMPGRDQVRVTLTGSGDLRGVADQARRVLVSVSTVTRAEAVQPQPPNVFFGQIGMPRRSGNNYVINGTYTTADPAARSFARHVLDQQLAGLETSDVTIDVSYAERVVSGVTNTPAVVARANAVAAAVDGITDVIDVTTITPMFSEDFGFFQDSVPGAMYFLGASNPERGWVAMPHAPTFHADEAVIQISVRAMGAIMMDQMRN